GDDQAPDRDHDRIGGDRAHRGQHRFDRADLAVDQQRKRHDTDDQHRRREQEADEVADDYQRPALGGGEDLADEMRNRGGRLIAEIGDVDRLRDGDPDGEGHEQQQTERRDRVARGRVQNVEGVLPGNVQTLLAAPAQLVETDRRERADHGETGRQRKQERQQGVAQDRPRQDQSDDRIDQTQEYGMAREGGKTRQARPRRS